MHVSEVFLGHQFLDPNRLHDLGHLNPRISHFPLLPLLEDPHGLGLFVSLHHLSLVSVSLNRLLQLLSAELHLSDNFGVGADSPLRERACQHVLLHQAEQVSHDALGIGL